MVATYNYIYGSFMGSFIGMILVWILMKWYAKKKISLLLLYYTYYAICIICKVMIGMLIILLLDVLWREKIYFVIMNILFLFIIIVAKRFIQDDFLQEFDKLKDLLRKKKLM